jgi:hypothetical protein
MRSQRGERHAVAVAAAGLALALGARAAGAADSEPIRIRFEAAGGCPDEAAFLDQIRARTAKARVAVAGEKARTFSVRLTQEGRSIRGRLSISIEESADTADLREVTGERCAEVVSALALITALAVDPRASTAPPARLPLPRLPAPPLGSGDASAPSPAAPPRSQLPPNHPAPYLPPLSWASLEVAPLPVIPGVVAARGSSWRFSVGMAVAAFGGIAPPLAAGATLFLEAARVDRGALAFAPSLRLAAIQVDSGYVTVAPVVARFQLRAARAELCPVRLVLGAGASASIGACASFDVGAVLAQGWAIGASESRLRPWAAPGAGGRLRWTIAENVELQLEGGGSFPLVRDTFFIAPNIDVHAVPATAGWFAGGVGVHFF